MKILVTLKNHDGRREGDIISCDFSEFPECIGGTWENFGAAFGASQASVRAHLIRNGTWAIPPFKNDLGVTLRRVGDAPKNYDYQPTMHLQVDGGK